ncbi:hypothetical protein FDK38_001771 [Candidozyma auris]|nr:hypothetical protein FDK38_001771 [[Candida] auris]
MPAPRRSARVASREEPAAKKPKTEEPVEESVEKTGGSELEVGDELPSLTLLDEKENEVDVAKVAKESKYLVIFAYPKASTPGCTRQACGFQKSYQDFVDRNTKVFGLSSDSPKAQQNFVSKQGLKYPLLSDPKRELIGLLGAKKSPSGTKRSHWIFVDGKLAVKKVQVSPEDSFTTALKDIEQFVAENGAKKDEGEPKKEDGEDATESKEEPKEEPEEEPKEESKEEPKEDASEATSKESETKDEEK